MVTRTPTGIMNTKDVIGLMKSLGIESPYEFSIKSGHAKTWLKHRIDGDHKDLLYPRSEAKLVNAFPQRMRDYFDAEYIADLKERFPEEFAIENSPSLRNKVKKTKKKKKANISTLDLNKVKAVAIGNYVMETSEVPQIDDQLLAHLVSALIEEMK